jgi:hypothetical protein
VSYGDGLALGLVSIDGLAAGADSLAEGATVAGASVGVGVEDGPQVAAAMAIATMAISWTTRRLSMVNLLAAAFPWVTLDRGHFGVADSPHAPRAPFHAPCREPTIPAIPAISAGRGQAVARRVRR